MSGTFKNKYRIDSTRLVSWDYGWDAAYYITICTQKREHYFGDIVNKKMNLSRAGIIADICWNEIKNHAANIQLGEYIIMPNHIHGILILDGNKTVGESEANHDSNNPVETRHVLSLPDNAKQGENEFYPLSHKRFRNPGKNTISSIIGSYKSAVSKYTHRFGIPFAWQARFYDRIIRDEDSLAQISDYIRNNPFNWELDTWFN